MNRTKTIFFSLLFISTYSFADNIRGPLKDIVDNSILLNNPVYETEISAEDLLSIIPDSNQLPDRISIEIRSSDIIKRFRDSFSFYSYRKIDPAPDPDIKSYTGRLVNSYLIPDRTRYFIDIVFNKNLIDKYKVPGTEIIDMTDISGITGLMFTILPVMKGVPDYLFSEYFKIKITTEWPESGILNIRVFASDTKSGKKEINDYSVFINDKKIDKTADIFLKTGIHKLSVYKDGYVSFEENITIKANDNRTVEAVLTKNNPQITVFSPEESFFFIDGIKQNNRVVNNLEEGEHTILFKLGEYSLSRKISLENGKKYNINLLLDIEIKEE